MEPTAPPRDKARDVDPDRSKRLPLQQTEWEAVGTAVLGHPALQPGEGRPTEDLCIPDGNGFLEPVGPNGGGFLGRGPSFVGGAALPGSTVGVDFNSWAPFVEFGPATGGWAPAQRTAQRSAEFNVKFQNTKLGQNVSVKTGAPRASAIF